MGILSFLSGSDEAAQAADDVADDAHKLPEVDAQRLRDQIAANTAGRLAEQPSRAAAGLSSGLADATKYAGGTAVGLGGLYVGGQATDRWAEVQDMESKEQNYSEYMARRKEILGNEELTSQQRQERLQALREAYEAAQSRDTSSNPISAFLGDLGPLEGLSLVVGLLIVLKLVRGGDA